MVECAMSWDGPVGRLTLSSRDGENRLAPGDATVIAAMAAALAERPEVRVLVLTATGSHFSRGWEALDAGAFDAGGRPELDPFGFLAELQLPVVCGIDGDAFSGGLELALACDVRIASPRARFAFPEAEFGLIPLAGGTQRLPRVIGRGRAAEMVMLGTVVNANMALQWGLVNAVAPGALEAMLMQTAATIAKRGPIAERFAKEAVRNGPEMPLARALRYELDLTVLLQTTQDRAEGVRAFAEKREPRFTGD